MSRIPLQTLPTFRAVAQLSNLRAAAEQLHLTHSAISQQIRLLEEQIGFPLFERRGRRVVLNAAGTVMLAAVESALAQLDAAVRTAAAPDTEQRLRITVLPSFAQHWLLPRMPRWRERHPGIAIEIHTSHQVMDLKRDGFHAAMRQGRGQWRGLEGTCLVDTPLIVVACPALARRLAGCDARALTQEPLLGDADRWERWFALAGHPGRVNPVAVFNDMGLLVQAAEQGMGIALCRELVAADALRDGRLVRLSPLALSEPGSDTYWLIHPPELSDWPPMQALRDWMQDEMRESAQELRRSQEQAAVPEAKATRRPHAKP
ncbi:MAG: LysR substrate-binding domain-containing protein [Pseudomonadota bacterium]